PQAQNALLGDLKKTDPALWPQLVQTFRASIAYLQQAAERTRRLAEQSNPPPVVAQQKPPEAHLLPQTEQGALAPGSLAAGSGYPNTGAPPVKLVSAEAPVGENSPNDWR